MIKDLKRPYVVLFLFAFSACIISYFRSGISSPSFPPLLTSMLNTSDIGARLVSSESLQLAEDTSDRKLSSAKRYKFHDGSQLYAVMVRVRKRDDFKIETYGLLTKGIDHIYIESPTFVSSIPYSMIGLIDGVKSLQTCIIPGTSDLEQVNVQLFPLLSQADRMSGSSQSILSKLLGTDDRSDYSCLVLTFQPKSFKTSQDIWRGIIRTAQMSMYSPNRVL